MMYFEEKQALFWRCHEGSGKAALSRCCQSRDPNSIPPWKKTGHTRKVKRKAKSFMHTNTDAPGLSRVTKETSRLPKSGRMGKKNHEPS
jgi:hypothetical protein